MLASLGETHSFSRNYSSRLVSWCQEGIGYAGNFAIWVLLERMGLQRN